MSTDEKAKPARRESFFRDVNERIEVITDAEGGELIDFICECADMGCMQTVALTYGEYESVRMVPTHFPIKPGHETLEIERIVEEHDRYVVVEKLGEAGRIAAKNDPRRRRLRRRPAGGETQPAPV